MNLLSLYSGIGGFDLAAARAGYKTVAFCEKSDYCRKLLAKRFPGIPIFEEDTHVTKQALADRGIEPAGIDIIVGGYPCQGESLAGERRGADDDRWRWPEMFRIIKELRPGWVLCENVVGHITMGLDSVLFDLESIGYTARPVVIPACAVGARHQRARVFILASNTSSKRIYSEQIAGGECQSPTISDRNGPIQFMADPDGAGCEEQYFATIPGDTRQPAWATDSRGSQWATEPAIRRVAHGVPGRLDRLGALGAAIVPQQIYPVFIAIRNYEVSRAA